MKRATASFSSISLDTETGDGSKDGACIFAIIWYCMTNFELILFSDNEDTTSQFPTSGQAITKCGKNGAFMLFYSSMYD